jgi:hypothetical protein
LSDRADGVARRLELMMASMHDLPEQRPRPVPEPAPERAPERERAASSGPIFRRHAGSVGAAS